MSTDTASVEALADSDIRELRAAADCAGLSQEFAALLDVATKSVAMADNYRAELRSLAAERDTLRLEVEILRQYGNKDCTAMADEALRATTPKETP